MKTIVRDGFDLSCIFIELVLLVKPWFKPPCWIINLHKVFAKTTMFSWFNPTETEEIPALETRPGRWNGFSLRGPLASWQTGEVQLTDAVYSSRNFTGI